MRLLILCPALACSVCFLAPGLRAQPRGEEVRLEAPWATRGLTNALASPSLHRPSLRLLLVQPKLYELTNPELRQATTTAIEEVMKSQTSEDIELVLKCLEELPVGVAGLSEWLQRVIESGSDITSVDRAYKILAPRKLLGPPFAELVRKRFPTEIPGRALPGDMEKRVRFLHGAKALRAEDLVPLRRELQKAMSVGEKLGVIKCIVDVGMISDEEVKTLREMVRSKAIGRFERQQAAELLLQSGRAENKDALHLFVALMDGVEGAYSDEFKRLVAIPGAKESVRELVLSGDGKDDPDSQLTNLAVIATIGFGTKEDAERARSVAPKAKPGSIRLLVECLAALNDLNKDDAPQIRRLMRDGVSKDANYAAQILQNLDTLDVADLEWLHESLDSGEGDDRLLIARVLIRARSTDPRLVAALNKLLADSSHHVDAYRCLLEMKKVSPQAMADLRNANVSSVVGKAVVLDLLAKSGCALSADMDAVVDAVLTDVGPVYPFTLAVLQKYRAMAGNAGPRLAANVTSVSNPLDEFTSRLARMQINPRVAVTLLVFGPFDDATLRSLVQAALGNVKAADEIRCLAIVGCGDNADRRRGVELLMDPMVTAQTMGEADVLRSLDQLNPFWSDEAKHQALRERVRSVGLRLTQDHAKWSAESISRLGPWRARLGIPDAVKADPSAAPQTTHPETPPQIPWGQIAVFVVSVLFVVALIVVVIVVVNRRNPTPPLSEEQAKRRSSAGGPANRSDGEGLTGAQYKQLVVAICKTFDEPGFVRFVRFRLDIDVYQCVGRNVSFEQLVFDFLQECERRREVGKLLSALVEERPKEERFRELAGPVSLEPNSQPPEHAPKPVDKNRNTGIDPPTARTSSEE